MLKLLEVLVCKKGADNNALTVDETSEPSTSVDVNEKVSDIVGLSVLLELAICPAALMLTTGEALEPSTSVELTGRAADAVVKLLDSLVCSGAADSDISVVVGELGLLKSAELCTKISLELLKSAELCTGMAPAVEVWSKLSELSVVVREAEIGFADENTLSAADIVLVEISGVSEVRGALVVVSMLLVVVKGIELALVSMGTLAVETSEAAFTLEAAKSADVLKVGA